MGDAGVIMIVTSKLKSAFVMQCSIHSVGQGERKGNGTFNTVYKRSTCRDLHGKTNLK